MTLEEFTKAHHDIWEASRNQALEEAAKYIESRAYGDGMVDEPADELAAAIRALKGKP